MNEKQFAELKSSLSIMNSMFFVIFLVLLLMFLFPFCNDSKSKEAAAAEDISSELSRIHSDLESLDLGISRFANFRTQLSPNSCPDCSCSCQ